MVKIRFKGRINQHEDELNGGEGSWRGAVENDTQFPGLSSRMDEKCYLLRQKDCRFGNES